MNYNPVFDTVAVVLLASIVIGFTSPSSPLRLITLSALASFTYHCLSSSLEYTGRITWTLILGGYTLFSLLHYLDVAIISGWSFDAQGPTNGLTNRKRRASNSRSYSRSRSRQLNIVPRIKFGFSTIFSWRFVNTPYQIRTGSRLDRISYSPGRFLIRASWTIIICCLVLGTIDFLQDNIATRKLYSPDKISLFTRKGKVPVRELEMRYFVSVGLSASIMALQRGVYAVLSFVCVATGLSSPSDWPPFTGPIFGSFSLRYFWSLFWPQTNSHWHHALANCLTDNILQLQKNGKLAQYLRVFLIFAISGVFHIAIDFSLGIPVADSGALRFFLIQPAGILIEDIVSLVPGTDIVPRYVQRYISFIWLSLWMTWTVPSYVYPIIHERTSGGWLVLISIINYIKERIFW
ncbi:membrane bound O-acyl transferase family-domain-containing protein [Daldinia sp. FL1419]|nr:membrane bound O-acyl transferase family-domain-containing protein [Daldinia sp. FL1419]